SYSIFIPTDLTFAPVFFLRGDTVRKSLQPTYNDSFSIPQRSHKISTTFMNGKEFVVSMNRLNLTYLDKFIFVFTSSFSQIFLS
ncbi:unnamed protein product, partial [Hymenolepis diminuta]